MKIEKFVYFAILIAMIAGTPVYSQIYSGPAFGSITGGDSISTTQVEGITSTKINIRKIFNPFWQKHDPPLMDNSFDKTEPLAPLGSNFQTDLAVAGTAEKLSDPPSVVNSFHGFDDPGGYIPPDPHFAAGPTT